MEIENLQLTMTTGSAGRLRRLREARAESSPGGMANAQWNTQVAFNPSTQFRPGAGS